MSTPVPFLPLSKPVIAAVSIGGLLLVILFALGVLGGKSSIEPGQLPLNSSTSVADLQLLTLSPQATNNPIRWQGTVRSRQDIKLLPKLSARILQMAVRPGDHVKQGQLIAQLDDRDLRAAHQAALAAHQAANAEAERASHDEKRISDLYQQQAATRQNYELVVATAQAARANASQAASYAAQSQVMLNENKILAPFDGVVGERFQDPGDMASPAQPLISLYQADQLRLETSIAGQCQADLSLGQTVMIHLDSQADTLSGTLDEVAPDLDPVSHSRLVKIKLPADSRIQHGQFGWLELACQNATQGLSIPVSAIVHYGQLETVQVLENGRLQTRHIRSGKQLGDAVEVLSGLHQGETILIKGAQ